MARADTTARGASVDPMLARVVARFLGYFALFIVLIAFVGTIGSWNTLMGVTASAATGLIRLTGVQATDQGNLVLLASHALLVDLPCTAIYMLALYSALVLAYPVPLRTRLLGLLVGIPVLIAANLARIVAAAQLSLYAPGAFQFFHDYLYQVVLALVCVLTWAAWLSYARRTSR